eukprot:TRINITY_DN1322_c0_g1_i6.p1 TRINITY_DN1322_c0_g1~~TRINITY_DN1322_c0_g1_i6.p1  ORF type:complete len:630 (+),score=114.38 TRINITY_DN1322_c0_g1_i6:1140-3029(+)
MWLAKWTTMLQCLCSSIGLMIAPRAGILGPSGSGKSTLLHSLCGQVVAAKRLQLSGRVFFNGAPRTGQEEIAFLHQQDRFYSALTVRETLLTAAKLRLPKSMSTVAQEERVDELISRLGLDKVRDTYVGDSKMRGVSGGEKRRLGIACELLGSPSVVLADEPTTGLDSFQASQVMLALSDLAKKGGHTVVCVIHQPRGSIVDLLDDMLVLGQEGKVVYSGPTDKVVSKLSSALGVHPSKNTNPAEFAIDLVSIDYSSKEAEAESRERLQVLRSVHVEAHNAALDAVRALDHKGSSNGKPVVRRTGQLGVIGQFRLLLQRSWRQVNRCKFANFTRAMTQVGSALIFGAIFWKLDFSQSRINDRLGLLQVASINTAMSVVVGALRVFLTERGIVERERSRAGSYGILPYFLAKLVAELPMSGILPSIFGVLVYKMGGLNTKPERFARFMGILMLESFAAGAIGMLVGAVSANEDTALALGPAIMTVFIIFSGFFIRQDNVPRLLRPLKEASLIKWAFEGMSVNEMNDTKFLCHDASFKRGPCIQTGEQMLDRIGFGDSTVRNSVQALAKILLASYTLTYFGLVASRPKYQPMLDPDEVAAEPEAEAARVVSPSSKQRLPGTAINAPALKLS